MRKEARLDFEAQICELRDAFNKCKDKLSREILWKEEVKRNHLFLEYQMGEDNMRIKTLENQYNDASYLILSNEYVYWMNLYRESRAAMTEDQRIIKDLQESTLSGRENSSTWQDLLISKFQNFQRKLQEFDWCMCPKNTPPQVFNFVTFCKKMEKDLTTDLAMIRKAKTQFKISCT